MDQNNATNAWNDTVQQGYGMMREYTDRAADLAANASSNLHDFTKREPWLALVAAFAVGYTMAPVIRRLLGRSGK